MPSVSVRYIVNDVAAAIAFYCQNLGFTEVMHPAPAFAMLSLGDLRLVLSAPVGGPGGGQAMPDGTVPAPGGWNRFAIEVPDLAATVEKLRRNGARFPQRDRHGSRRPADPRRGPVGQPRGAVRADLARGQARSVLLRVTASQRLVQALRRKHLAGPRSVSRQPRSRMR
jgi:catechol 2,3-dioxygenase-like lactoylglutathione lyase family enzyme